MKLFKLSDFKKLNGLSPTVESTLLKLDEEKGEVSQVIGKLSKRSGEEFNDIPLDLLFSKLFEELMDVCQVCATMIYILQEFDNLVDLNCYFNKNENFTSTEEALLDISILQGEIATIVRDEYFNLSDCRLELVNYFYDICSISCNCIYSLIIESNYNLNDIYTKHTNKLLAKKYIQ